MHNNNNIIIIIINIVIGWHRIWLVERTIRYRGEVSTTTHFIFHPIAIDIAGTWDDMAIELVQEIGRHTTVIT